MHNSEIQTKFLFGFSLLYATVSLKFGFPRKRNPLADHAAIYASSV